MTGAQPIDHDRVATLWDVIACHADDRPDAPALRFDGVDTSYAALLNWAGRLAGYLAARGIGPGDRIAFLGKNSDRYFVLLYAVARVGAVLVPLNWRLAAEEWRFILRDAEAKLLFADSGFLAQAGEVAAETDTTFAGAIPDAADHAAYAGPTPSPDDAVFQVYTSGTTGRPKGAVLSHRNMLALRAPGYRAGLRWFPEASDRTLAILPVAHIAGTAYVLFGLYGGGLVIVAAEFDPGLALRLIAAERISHVLLAPAAMRQMLDHADACTTDLATLRYITYGASPIPEALLARALETFGCGFVQMYGMSEAAGGVVALSPEDHVAPGGALLRSAGRAMPGVEIGIVDGDGTRMAAGETGEVVVRSRAVMQGYWRLPEETARTILPGDWLRSGDVGRIDEQGYLFILDRVKDMIVSGGENIYPAEVENAIFGHPGVADVAVIGVPSERWGEEVMAMVVPRPGHSPDLTSIADWARGRIAAFKVPRQMALVEELPRNAGNKVLRRLLREPYWQGLDRRVH
ncbi:long-chain-fatty-acid--CoA ligase [Sphingomonas profundi]|uniref:long-chain-fatty-acid--CoA ligase n=1 Tax=Alterirhizorhabdus profundi TaxID=2681549 RepID=UPI0018D00063|nr:long-chain-fatty-acid--CoA ligase [Sphingomonas profundi]